MKITDAFQIYVINLPERTDRLATALKEMRKIGLERGDAGLTIFSAIKPSDAAGFHRASIRGIFLSQLACLEDAYKRGKHALIFEDDIALATSLAPLLDQILKTLETSEWGFCYLGHESSGDIPRAGRRASSFSLKPHTGDMIGAHFVMVHRSVLPKLIQHLLTVQSGRPGDDYFGPMPVDGAYNIFRRLNPDMATLISDPKFGWQRPSRSDITPRWYDQWKNLRRVIDALRVVKNAVLQVFR